MVNEKEKRMEATAKADKIMEFTLRHVPFDGWTMDALKRGAVDAGADPDEALGLFQNDPLIMIEYYSRMLDQQVKAAMEEKDTTTMKIKVKIAEGVMIRLQLMAPYREAAQKAAVILSMPLNAPLGSKLLFETVDNIWYLAGDNAADFNYYTKRALLSAVYTSTLLYWFRDMSSEFTNTREFLMRRIDNVMIIPKLKAKVKSGLDKVRGYFSRG
jgi:ubiquinone biosynthesis protein COQ9